MEPAQKEQVVILNLGNRQAQRTNGRCFGIGIGQRRWSRRKKKQKSKKQKGEQVVILNLGNRQAQRTNGRCFGIGIGHYLVQYLLLIL